MKDWALWGRRALVALAILLVLLSFLPLWDTDRWWVRQWDYPRIQVAGLLLIVGAALGLAGAVMQALAPSSKASDHGLSYLRQAQRPGGGFPLGGNGGVNTPSTAWAIQGILATGGNPWTERPVDWGGGADPVTSRVEAPWTEEPSVYGPFGTLLHGLSALVGGDNLRQGVWVWQLLVVASWVDAGKPSRSSRSVCGSTKLAVPKNMATLLRAIWLRMTSTSVRTTWRQRYSRSAMVMSCLTV